MSDYKAETGGRMFELRKSQGKSQAEVAEYIGLTVAAYQNYEAGRREAGYEVLCKIADMFNVSLDYLLGRTEVREMNRLPKDEPTEEEVKSLENQIVESYTQMSVETRRACIKALMQIVGDVFLDLQDEDEEEPQDSAG